MSSSSTAKYRETESLYIRGTVNLGVYNHTQDTRTRFLTFNQHIKLPTETLDHASAGSAFPPGPLTWVAFKPLSFRALVNSTSQRVS